LIKPLGFSLDDRYLKRAGLDYWKKVDLQVWEHIEEFLAGPGGERPALTSSKQGACYHQVSFRAGDYILFGPETTGLSAEMFTRFPDRIARIPVRPDSVRSLNLSVSVGIVVYEALKQIGGLPS
jgi:tRNA (cytidine/uridine-2'-O-)-methyltransferase